MFPIGTLYCRNQVSCYAADETIPRYGTIVGWGKDSRCSSVAICDPRVSSTSGLSIVLFFIPVSAINPHHFSSWMK